MKIASGSLTNYLKFVAVDETDKETRLTGLDTFTVTRDRNALGPVAFTTPTVVELDAALQPGVYALLLDEDMDITDGLSTEEVTVHITHAGMFSITRSYELYNPVPLTQEQIDGIAEEIIEAINELGVNTNIKTSGGTFHAQISNSSLHPRKYLEIIQGEEKIITFIVEPLSGLFDQATPEFLEVKIADPLGTLVTITDASGSDSDSGELERLTQELEVQVFRITLTSDDTRVLSSGVAKIEITIDTQKARLTQALKVVEELS
jgi:hypothetical protein